MSAALRDVPRKPSTLSWTESVPAHWRVGNIRRFAQMKTGHTPSRSVPEYWETTTVPWFTLADVWQLRDGRQMYVKETRAKISELGLTNSAAELLPAGTVILSRTASVGFTGIMRVAMATSQDYWNWICGPDLLPEYLVFLFRAMRSEFDALMIGSTHQTIYQPTAAAIRIPLPPLDEQRAIADFLDDQTSRTDTLIDKQTQLITTLRERRGRAREALAVNVGSGDRLKWRLAEIDERAGSRSGDLPLMSVSIDWGVRRRDEITSDDYRADDLGVYKVCARGDIVVNRMRAFQGALGVAPEDGLVSPDYAVLRPRSTALDCDWMVEVMRTRAFIGEMVLRIRGIGGIDSGAVRTPRINVTDLFDIRVAPTPVAVQVSDLEVLRAQTVRIDALIEKAERHIALAKERRVALITAAVTGQIDVRTAGRMAQGVA